jgi:hypothetical protein
MQVFVASRVPAVPWKFHGSGLQFQQKLLARQPLLCLDFCAAAENAAHANAPEQETAMNKPKRNAKALHAKNGRVQALPRTSNPCDDLDGWDEAWRIAVNDKAARNENRSSLLEQEIEELEALLVSAGMLASNDPDDANGS